MPRSYCLRGTLAQQQASSALKGQTSRRTGKPHESEASGRAGILAVRSRTQIYGWAYNDNISIVAGLVLSEGRNSLTSWNWVYGGMHTVQPAMLLIIVSLLEQKVLATVHQSSYRTTEKQLWRYLLEEKSTERRCANVISRDLNSSRNLNAMLLKDLLRVKLRGQGLPSWLVHSVVEVRAADSMSSSVSRHTPPMFANETFASRANQDQHDGLFKKRSAAVFMMTWTGVSKYAENIQVYLQTKACMCTYIYTYIYMWYPPKKKRSMYCVCFQLFPSRPSPHDHPSPLRPHKPRHALTCLRSSPNVRTNRPHWNPMRPNISTWPRGGPHWNIEPHWVSIWRIQDPRFPRTLGEESWITDLGSALLKFNMASIFQYDPPWIQDSSQEFRAILDNLGSAILKFNTFQYFNISMRSSPLLGFVISTVFCDSLQVHICGTQKNKTTNGHLAPRTWKACYRVCLGPYSA